jgi:hypothetical protein
VDADVQRFRRSSRAHRPRGAGPPWRIRACWPA